MTALEHLRTAYVTCNAQPGGWQRLAHEHLLPAIRELEGATMIPSHLTAGLERYLTQRIEPGGFLRAVLENDLTAALQRADEVSARALAPLVSYLHEHAPSTAWGSAAAVSAWLAGRR